VGLNSYDNELSKASRLRANIQAVGLKKFKEDSDDESLQNNG